MRTWNMYMMAAAMAVATMGMSVHAADTTTTPPEQNTSDTANTMQHIGGQMADESTTKDVRETLAKIVNDGVETNKFSSLTSYLAKADRQRLGDEKNMNNDDLNNAITQFRQDFKSKYNQDFDISATQLSDVMVYAGMDKKSATASFAKPSLSSTLGESTNTMNNGAAKLKDTATNGANDSVANTNMGMSSLTLNLINEGHVMNAWRISAPQLSAEQLKDNLVKHIQMLDDEKATWPTDVNAAYRAVSYHVLSAFSDSAIASER